MPHKDLSYRDTLFHRQPEHEHFLFEGMEFPATREELVRYATDAEVDVDRQNLIRSLPDRVYEDRESVWRAMGEAARRFGVGLRDEGTPRDDIGKQATVVDEDHVRHP